MTNEMDNIRRYGVPTIKKFLSGLMHIELLVPKQSPSPTLSPDGLEQALFHSIVVESLFDYNFRILVHLRQGGNSVD